jgi:hypothetical protein
VLTIHKTFRRNLLELVDPLLARHLLHGESDAMMSKDSDFAAYAGDKCLFIHDFRYSNRREGCTLDKIILRTGESKVAEDAVSESVSLGDAKIQHTRLPTLQWGDPSHASSYLRWTWL